MSADNILQQQLIKKWQPVLDATKHIFSWSGDGELAYWAEEASKASKIIEIGTHFGRSAKVMLLANPKASLWCIDGFEQDGTEHTARYFLRGEIEDGRCTVFKHHFDGKTPFSTAAFFNLVEFEPFDMILVDNGHRESEVKEQILCFQPLLRRGGLLCGHDLDRNPDNGVTKAVKELLPQFTEEVPRVWSVRIP